MSALRMAELINKRVTDRIDENRANMEKGVGHDQYMKLVGRIAELRWVKTITAEYLTQVEGEELEDDF